MNDDTNNPQVPEVAPQGTEAQIEQPADGEESANAPATQVDKEEKLYVGKFKSPEEMEKAYLESESKMNQALREKAALERRVQQVPEKAKPVSARFDPETEQTLTEWYEERRLAEKAAEEESKVAAFVEKHKEDLADEFVDGLVRKYIADARVRGEYLDQEKALKMAKDKVAEGIKPRLEQAKADGVEEGRNIQKTKEELGAVGGPANRTKVDPNSLSSKEYAEYFGLNRVE